MEAAGYTRFFNHEVTKAQSVDGRGTAEGLTGFDEEGFCCALTHGLGHPITQRLDPSTSLPRRILGLRRTGPRRHARKGRE